MANWKVGDTVGYLPKIMQKRYLMYAIQRNEAWAELKHIGLAEIKLFSEISREFKLEDWVFNINNLTGSIVLERHKTIDEIRLGQVEQELIEDSEGKVEANK